MKKNKCHRKRLFLLDQEKVFQERKVNKEKIMWRFIKECIKLYKYEDNKRHGRLHSAKFEGYMVGLNEGLDHCKDKRR